MVIFCRGTEIGIENNDISQISSEMMVLVSYESGGRG